MEELLAMAKLTEVYASWHNRALNAQRISEERLRMFRDAMRNAEDILRAYLDGDRSDANAERAQAWLKTHSGGRP